MIMQRVGNSHDILNKVLLTNWFTRWTRPRRQPPPLYYNIMLLTLMRILIDQAHSGNLYFLDNSSSHFCKSTPFISSSRYGMNGFIKGSFMMPGAKSEVVVSMPLVACGSPLSTPSSARTSSWRTSFPGL